MNDVVQLLCVVVSLTGGIHCVSLLRHCRKPAASPVEPLKSLSKSARWRAVREKVNWYCQVLLATTFLAVAGSLLVGFAYRGLSLLWKENPLDQQLRRSIAIVSSPGYPPVIVKYDTTRPAGEAIGIECHSKAVPDDHIHHLLHSAPTLRFLNLAHTDVSDNALGDVGRMKRLSAVTLIGTRVGDAGVQQLARLRNLKDLRLDGTNVTDKGLRFLVDVKGLRELGLRNTAVTDASLEWLGCLDRLELLDVRNTGVTEEGVNRLRSERPGVEILSTVH
ncbi:MAG: hypothetical protein ACOX1P_16105 [Thermoguttaceae bacterium]|jgi:hypothetical protein